MAVNVLTHGINTKHEHFVQVPDNNLTIYQKRVCKAETILHNALTTNTENLNHDIITSSHQ